uniref:Reverse transcriptase domain-containing protein n=1 Tax=Sander lucioperca TaxID=283035 RepID=A0A8C9ZB38_SANLU
MYADDTIVFLSHLEESIPSLLELFNVFGNISGFKVNKEKSSIMFNINERTKPVVSHPFVNATEGFKYLGIRITPKISILSSANYEPMVVEVSEEITRWTTLPLSLLGRINIIKITILPKFLYIFQSIPLAPPPFFPKTRKVLSNFIWNNRKPRLRLSLLYLPYERGGLQLPNLEWYYWAAQLRTTMFWFSKDVFLPWLEIEKLSSKGLSLNSYLYSLFKIGRAFYVSSRDKVANGSMLARSQWLKHTLVHHNLQKNYLHVPVLQVFHAKLEVCPHLEEVSWLILPCTTEVVETNS